MKPSLTLIKVGGQVVEEPETLKQLLTDFSKLQGHKLLVHGGGRSATKMAERLGIETKMVEGRRITDAETLQVVTMVYGGLVNKNIVAGLQSMGCNAIGMTGADLNLVLAKKRSHATIDYGFVGDVVSVQVEALIKLIDQDIIPVIAPLSHDKEGNMLNTNADTIASELAIALSNHFDVNLVFCFEKKGVLRHPQDENSVIPHISLPLYHTLQEEGVITDGMIPKLSNSFNALRKGVSKVTIANTQSIQNNFESGTTLTL